MKQLCLIFALFVLPTFGFSQFIGDSVIIYINNRVEINLAVPDYDNLRSSDAETSALKEFQEIIPKIQDQLSSGSADLVKYVIGGTLTIEPGDQKKIYQNKNGELVNTGVRDKAIISGEDFKILITTTDLSKITDMPLAKCLEGVIDSLPEKKNWSRSLYYECIDGNVKVLETKNNQLDYLDLNAGAGAGLYKNSLVPDLTLGAGIGLNHKGSLRYPYISTNILFYIEPERRGKTRINTFINLGYGWHFNKQAKEEELISVELGYLVLRNGDLFRRNTFKLGVNWSPGKGIIVSPNLFINSRIQSFDMFISNIDISPGIRVGFGF